MKVPYWPLAPVLVLLLATAPVRAAVHAWVDHQSAAPGETIELTLEYIGRPGGQPDLAPLSKDFRVLGSNASTTIEIVNGRVSERTQVTVSLSPRHGGRLTVPSVMWSGEQSPPLALNVELPGHGAAAQGRQVFFETEVDAKQPYVQAAVRVTVKLYTRQSLYRPSIAFDSGSAAVIRQVGSDEEATVERGGEPYEVLTRHYVLFPQQSGSVSVPGPVLSAQLPAGPGRARFWGSDPFAGVFSTSPLMAPLFASKPIRVEGDPIALNVRSRPAAAASSYWLPARGVTLQGSWHPPAAQAHVGDPVTLDVSLQADGLTAAQLPDLTQLLQLPAGVRVYPDAPKLSDTSSGDGIVGLRTQSIALIADQPGRFTVPALHVHWWDTQSNQQRDETLPERVFLVLPAQGAGSASSAAANAPGWAQVGSTGRPQSAGATSGATWQAIGEPGPWRQSLWLWVSAGLALAWGTTLAAWLRLRRRVASVAAPAGLRGEPNARDNLSAARSRTAFLFACRCNDPPGARRHLLGWIRAASPEAAPAGLNAFARQIEDPDLARLVRELDRACYAGEHWRGDALGAALTELPLLRPGAAERTPGAALAPLYPQIDAPREGYV